MLLDALGLHVLLKSISRFVAAQSSGRLDYTITATYSTNIIMQSVSEAPSCGLDGRAVTIYIYIYTAGTRYYACAALRANVAGRIGNPAESAFLVPSATSLTLAP